MTIKVTKTQYFWVKLIMIRGCGFEVLDRSKAVQGRRGENLGCIVYAKQI